MCQVVRKLLVESFIAKFIVICVCVCSTQRKFAKGPAMFSRAVLIAVLIGASALAVVHGAGVEERASAKLRGSALQPEGLDLLSGVTYPEFVSRKAKDYKSALQRLRLATGTDVTVWGDQRLTKEEMFTVAQHVVGMTKGKIMRCFCRFTPSNVGKKLTTAQKSSTNGDQAEVMCSCSGIGPGASATLDGPAPRPKDFYGNPLDVNSTLTERMRYPLPSPAVFSVPTEGLILSLDAGDKNSFDPKTPGVWKDVSESEDPVAKRPAEIHGFVGFNESEGGGALRIGAHDDRDVIVVKNLDISPIKMPSVSVEIWVKLAGIRHPRGRAFGNVLSGFGGRALNIHDTRYGPRFAEKVPNYAVDPSYCAMNGRVALTAGHRFTSKVKTPRSGEWTQFIGTFDKTGTTTLYVNGQWKDQQLTFSDGDELQSQGSKDFAIGNHQFEHKGGNFKLNGYIGLVRVFDRVLGSDDVSTLYEHSRKRFGHVL